MWLSEDYMFIGHRSVQSAGMDRPTIAPHHREVYSQVGAGHETGSSGVAWKN